MGWLWAHCPGCQDSVKWSHWCQWAPTGSPFRPRHSGPSLVHSSREQQVGGRTLGRPFSRQSGCFTQTHQTLPAELEPCASHLRGIVCEKWAFGMRVHFPPIKAIQAPPVALPDTHGAGRIRTPPGVHLNALIAGTWQEGRGPPPHQCDTDLSLSNTSHYLHAAGEGTGGMGALPAAKGLFSQRQRGHLPGTSTWQALLSYTGWQGPASLSALSPVTRGSSERKENDSMVSSVTRSFPKSQCLI